MATRRNSKRKPPRPQTNDTPIWKPQKVGEELAGEITRMDVVNTRHGDTAIVDIEDEEGETWGVWCGVQLGEKLYDVYDVGDSVIITYQGTEDTDAGYRVNVFDVEEWE
jgi:hypothetical protein